MSRKKNQATRPGGRPWRSVKEQVIDTPEGPMLRVRIDRSQPVETIRNTAFSVRAYRPVVGVTARMEVLSPCGHEVPRFDQTEAFRQFTLYGVPYRYPRARLCPQCTTHPTHASLKRVQAEVQVASDWGSLTKPQREMAAKLLAPLLADRPGPGMDAWPSLTPAERGQLAAMGEKYAGAFGLTFREFLSLHPDSVPTLTRAGERRLKSSPEEKQARRDRADARALQAQWERDQG